MSNLSLIERIKQLSFTEYEAKCYLALFQRESLTVGEVSKLAGIPRPNAYEAMEKLLSKGLSVSIPGKMKKYAAADPWFLREKSLENLSNSMEAALEDLEKKRKEILDEKKAIQENIEGIATELDSYYDKSRANGSPLDYIEILKDPFQIHRKFMQLCSQANKEIVMFTKPPYASATNKHKDEQDQSQFEAMKKGVKIRSIYEIPSAEPEQVPFIEAIPNAVSHGEEARVIEELPIKLAVIDEKVALYVMEDPVLGKLSITTVVAENSALSKSFKLLFESFWEKARDYYVIGGRKIMLSSMDKKRTRGKTS